MSKTTNKFSRKCASVRCGWCWITSMNILALGGDHLDRGQDRLHGPDAERVG